MDIKHFKIQEWVERDIIAMRRIDTKDNRADAMTKALNSTLFYRHTDRIMGNHIPVYAYTYIMNKPSQNQHTTMDTGHAQEHGGGVSAHS